MRYFIVHLHRLLDPETDRRGPGALTGHLSYAVVAADHQVATGCRGRLVSAAAYYLRFVWKTTRFSIEPPDAVERVVKQVPIILAMWHGQHFLTPFIRPKDQPAQGADLAPPRRRDQCGRRRAARRRAPFAARARMGRTFPSKGGVFALQRAVRALREGYNVAMTADVPQGVARGRARHRQARADVRPADLSRRDRDPAADRARQLGSHHHQPAVQPRGGRGGRADPRAAGCRRRDARTGAARGRGGAQRGDRPAPTRSSTAPRQGDARG